MKKFQLINYKSKPVVKIETEHLFYLKRGKYCKFGEYLKLPPLEENLILEMLPEEVLLYIFQFLSPGALIRIASTCQTLNELSQDINTWRNISYSYSQFFTFDKVEVEKRSYAEKENQIEIYGIIDQNLLTNIDTSPLLDPKKNKKITSILSSFFTKNENDTQNKIDTVFDQNENQKKIIEYIEKVPNPKEELISKGNLIYNGFSERKKQIEQNLKRKVEDEKRWKNIKKTENFGLQSSFLFVIGLGVFLIALNIHIEKKLSSNVTYVFIPLFFPIFLLMIFFFILTKFENDSTILIFPLLLLIIFTQLLLIGLRADSIIKGSWLLVFIPLLVLLAIFIIISIIWIVYQYTFEWEYSTTPMVLIMIFLFLIFLGLRLDETIKWNYGIVFIPLFFINLFPFWMRCGLCIEDFAQIFLSFFIFLIVSIPFSLFEIFLVLFLEGNPKFTHITYAFIPIYVMWSLFSLWLCFLVFFNPYGGFD